jgi:hypothetical protein
MALVGVILLLILASGVLAALSVSGRTETLMAYNAGTSAQARGAAQAGLTAAAQAVIHEMDTTSLTVDEAMDAMLKGPDGNAATTGDNGSIWKIEGVLTGLPAPGVKASLNNIEGVSYTVQVQDDDDWTGRTVSPAGVNANISENGSIYDDANKKIVIRSIGYGRNRSTVTLEATITRAQLAGIVVGGNLRMSGAAGSVSGTGGSVHANHNIVVNGHPTVAGTVSAVGTVSGAPNASAILQNQRLIEIPPIDSADFVRFADWKLLSSGWVQKKVAGVWTNWCNAASVSCTVAVNGGVSFSGGNWTIRPAASGRYYAQGNASSGGDLTNVSIYATGNISVGNNDDVTAAATADGVALVADGNIDIGGGANVTGSIYAREAVDFGGNHTIIGQVVAENRSDPTADNRFHGNVDIIWNGDTMIGTFGVTSWREVK